MKHYFDRPIIKKATEHAIKEWPNESCGFIVDNNYIPLENIHGEPLHDFRISEEDYLHYVDDIQCVMHSHNDIPHCSSKDMEQQIATALPWGIINLKMGNYANHWFWGDQLPIQDYIGRPFHYGTYDCYSLIRDFYKQEYDILLPNAPRDFDFWFQGKNLFADYLAPKFKNGEFYIVSSWKELKRGDILLSKMNTSKVWNHSGIYIGDNRIMHHFENKLSQRALLNNWIPYIDTIVRHRDVNND